MSRRRFTNLQSLSQICLFYIISVTITQSLVLHAQQTISTTNTTEAPKIPELILETTGSNYGDMLDDLREQMKQIMYKRDQPDSLSRITNIKNLLTKMHRDLSQEQGVANELYKHMRHDFKLKTQHLNVTITSLTQWLNRTQNITQYSTEKLLNLTRYLEKAPMKISQVATQLEQLVSYINEQKQIRKNQNQAFRSKELYIRDNIVAVNHVLDTLGRRANQSISSIFTTNLKQTLDNHHTRRYQTLAEVKTRPKIPQDMDDLRIQLEILSAQLHQYLTTVITREATRAAHFNTRLTFLKQQKNQLNTRLTMLEQSVPKTRDEMHVLSKRVSSLQLKQPSKKLKLQRMLSSQKRHFQAYRPVFKRYRQLTKQRLDNLRLVQTLLRTIRERFYTQIHTQSPITLSS